eukprot:g11495.t1
MRVASAGIDRSFVQDQKSKALRAYPSSLHRYPQKNESPSTHSDWKSLVPRRHEGNSSDETLPTKAATLAPSVEAERETLGSRCTETSYAVRVSYYYVFCFTARPPRNPAHPPKAKEIFEEPRKVMGVALNGDRDVQTLNTSLFVGGLGAAGVRCRGTEQA